MYKYKNPKKNRKKILYIFHMESWQIDMFLLKLWDIPFFIFWKKYNTMSLYQGGLKSGLNYTVYRIHFENNEMLPTSP